MRKPRRRPSAALVAALLLIGACNDDSRSFSIIGVEVMLETPEPPPAGATVTAELRYEEIAAKQARLDADAAAAAVSATAIAAVVATLDPAPFARIAHLTDVQIREERAFFQSRAGTRFLELLSRGYTPTEGAKRPSLMEANSPFVWLATVLTLNAIHAQRPFDTAIHTGDAIDSGLRSELAHFLFVAHKLAFPFLSVAGNHDILTFGLFGSLGPVSGLEVDPSIERRTAVEPAFQANQERLLFDRPTYGAAFREISTALGPATATAQKFASQHFGTDLGPMPDDLFYAVTVRAPGAEPGLVLVVLETSRDSGTADGEIDGRQLRFLNDTLDLAATRASLVVVAAHHPIFEVSRDHQKLGDPTDVDVSQALGTVHQILTHYPNVVLYLCGHTHLPDIQEQRDFGSGALQWTQIDSGALLVAPQEGAIVELLLQGGAPATEVRLKARKIGALVDPASALGQRVAESRAAAAQDLGSVPRYQTLTTYDATRALPAFPVAVPKFPLP